ncbi:family 79 glycoside hydrolase [Cryphonectria parasitica EP155]|uniref:Family 79 glycoside hydrolase n=1 Tax=Cryphonectria parasitica (strain ATCC 38755 / EP155) TaxID=660469 RepID=A0A9P4XXD7_CRYP1|nr:family 79 glycoside hydrolase [Cryphonectria parasitica EP155]KAF3762674.1 family 79 glycoside hydrolase [Cryphonectria parasitica EP155]
MAVTSRLRAMGRAAAMAAASQLVSSAFAASNTISISPTETPPSDIAGVVDVSFAGFGIEPSNLFSFTGEEDTNDLSINLMANLANYTGKPPHIRLGGNTEDYMLYDSTQDKYAEIRNTDATGNGSIKWDSMLIGPRFFEAANRFPDGTPVTWGLNLAYNDDDYIDRITTMAQQVFDRCTNLDIVAFEIGNEPDLYYASSLFRDSSWTGEVYSQEWLERAQAIYEQVIEPTGLGMNFFEPQATSHTSGTTFEIEQLVTDGITNQTNGSSYVTNWNQHDYTYFFGVATYDLTLEAVMSFDLVEDQLENQASDQLTQSAATAYGYALREMGWVGPIGSVNVTDTFGGALYTLNFLLYAASLNMTGVNFHMTATSYTSAWQPVYMDGVAPYPRPLYYGQAAFDQIIGPTCTAQVYQYALSDVPTGYDSYLRAYAVYQSSTLSSITVVNGKIANTTETDKSNLTVSLTMPTSLAGKTVYLAYLTNDGLDAKYNTTWNGISYEASGDGTPTQVSDAVETATIASDGTLTLSVRDSAAVVAQIGSKVGSLTADSAACSSMAALRPGTYGLSAVSSSASSKPESDGTTSSTSSGSSSTSSSDGTDSNKSAGMRSVPFSLGLMLTVLVSCVSMATGVFLF